MPKAPMSVGERMQRVLDRPKKLAQRHRQSDPPPYEVDVLAGRLRSAAGLLPQEGLRGRHESRSFLASVGGAHARVQIDHIDGEPVGGIQITLRSLTPDAAEAVLRFLAGRNGHNSPFSQAST